MKSGFMLMFFLSMSITGWSQRKKYDYTVEKKVYIVDSIYDCIESEFSFIRQVLSKNEFVDYSFYYNGRDTTYKMRDTFKIRDGDWSIKQKARWRYFFSEKGFNDKKHTPSCYLLGNDSYLLPVNVNKKSGGKLLYIFRLMEKEGHDKLFYIFDPKVGFVSMEVGRCKIVLNN